MSIDLAGTNTTTIDSDRWPALVRVPDGPLGTVSGLIADRLLRRAVARMPVRLVDPNGFVVGAADPTLPTMVECMSRRPSYDEYRSRTSFFIPRRPRSRLP